MEKAEQTTVKLCCNLYTGVVMRMCAFNRERGNWGPNKGEKSKEKGKRDRDSLYI